MQKMMLLGMEHVAFRPFPASLEQQPQLVIVGINSSSESICAGSMRRLAAHAPAAVSRDGVKPDSQSLRVADLGEVTKGAIEHLLHGVFGIFRMPAYFHAEGVDGVLQQPDRLFNSFRSV